MVAGAAYTTGRLPDPSMTSAFTITASRGSRGRHAAKRGAKKDNGGNGNGGNGGGRTAGGSNGGNGGDGASAPAASAALKGAVVKRGRWWWIGGLAVVAGMAYVPLLAVRPGVVTPDTKTYLYLDPTKFLSQVAFMWNPTVGLGTVNHQYIGYLFPMGPFYAVFHLLGVPVWVSQRLWLGTILFGAGLGVLYLSQNPRPEGARAHGGGARLHAVALLPAVRRADLGDPAALGGPAVHVGPDHRGAAPGRLARAGAVRLRRRPGERHQCELGHLCRCRADPVAVLRGRGAARVDLAPRVGDRAAHRRADPGRVRVVDRGVSEWRPPTASTSSNSQRRSPRRRPPPTRPTSSAASATGTSTAPTTSARGRTRRCATPRTSG